MSLDNRIKEKCKDKVENIHLDNEAKHAAKLKTCLNITIKLIKIMLTDN